MVTKDEPQEVASAYGYSVQILDRVVNDFGHITQDIISGNHIADTMLVKNLVSRYTPQAKREGHVYRQFAEHVSTILNLAKASYELLQS